MNQRISPEDRLYKPHIYTAKELKIIDKLTTAIQDEEDDINEYRKAAQNTDPKTAKLMRHIAKQEVHHKQELTNRLKQIR